jgi:hypothetical protein
VRPLRKSDHRPPPSAGFALALPEQRNVEPGAPSCAYSSRGGRHRHGKLMWPRPTQNKKVVWISPPPLLPLWMVHADLWPSTNKSVWCTLHVLVLTAWPDCCTCVLVYVCKCAQSRNKKTLKKEKRQVVCWVCFGITWHGMAFVLCSFRDAS